jgi:hypothetical protein
MEVGPAVLACATSPIGAATVRMARVRPTQPAAAMRAPRRLRRAQVFIEDRRCDSLRLRRQRPGSVNMGRQLD